MPPPGTPSVVPPPGTPSVVPSPGTPSVVPPSGTPSVVPPPGTPSVVPPPGTPSVMPPPGTPSVVPPPGTPSVVPPPGTPSVVPPPGTPSVVPPPGTPSVVPPPGTPSVVPPPGTPSVAPPPGTSVVPPIGTPSVMPPPATPSVLPPPGTPSVLPPPGTPSVVPPPGTPSVVPPPGTPSVVLPPGTPSVVPPPGTPSVVPPPGTPSVVPPPGTPSVVPPPGTPSVVPPPNTPSVVPPPGTPSVVLPPGTQSVVPPPGTPSVVPPPGTPSVVPPPGTPSVVPPPDTPSVVPPSGTPSVVPPPPGTPSVVPPPGTPSVVPPPGTPSVVPPPGTPSVVPPPGTPSVVPPPETPSVVPPPGTPSVVPPPPGTPSVVPPPGTPSVVPPPGTPSVVPPPGTPSVAPPPGTPSVMPPPGTPSFVPPPGTPSVLPPPGTLSVVPPPGTPSVVPPPGTPSVVPPAGTPSVVPPPGTPSVVPPPVTPSFVPPPGTPSVVPPPGTPSVVPPPGTPSVVPLPGTPSVMPPPGTPSVVPPPGTPSVVPPPGTPSVVPPPGTPSVVPPPGTPIVVPPPGTPSVVPPAGTPSVVPPPGTPSVVPPPGTPSVVPPPGTPSVVLPPSTPNVLPPPGTPSVVPPGTPSVVPPPGTPSVVLPPGTPSVVLPPGTPSVVPPPGTPSVVPPPGTPRVVPPPGTPSVVPPPSTPSVVPPPGTPSVVPPPGTPSVVPPPGTPSVVPPPVTPSVVPPPGTPSVVSPPGTPSVMQPPGTPSVEPPPGTPDVVPPLGTPTAPTCEYKVIDLASDDFVVTASSSDTGNPEEALGGSLDFWSPTDDDVEDTPFWLLEILSSKGDAEVEDVEFNVKYSTAVTVTFINKDNRLVGTKEDNLESEVLNRVSFKGIHVKARYVKIYTPIVDGLPLPQVGDVVVRACYSTQVTTTPHVSTATRSACLPDQFTCHNGMCVNRTQICDGTLNCADGSDEEKCTTLSSIITTTAPAGWSSWTPWSECSVNCGEGVRTRQRVCQGEPCKGKNVEEEPCTEAPCACYFTQEDFEKNFGFQGSNPIGWIEKDGEFGLTSDDERVEIDDEIEDGVTVHVECNNCTCDNGFMDCSNKTCKEDCHYTQWSSWSTCSKSCDVGQRSRSRKAIQGSLAGKPCVEPTQQVEDCNTDNCPEPPEWSTWSAWSTCSATCNGGVTTRTRTCTKSGKTNKDEDCDGEPLESAACNTDSCTTEGPPSCEGGKVYKNCSESCPRTCQELRMSAICIEPEACEPGCGCKEGEVEYRGQCILETNCPCYDDQGNEVPEGIEVTDSPCEVCSCKNGQYKCQQKDDCDTPCGWSDWTSWGECSVTCGEGTKTRYRTPNNPAPTGNGAECEGPSSETVSCQRDECPAACFQGNSSYTIGQLVSTDECTECYCRENIGIVCNEKEDAIVDGGYTGWSSWSQCNSDCVGGMKRRTRTCANPLPKCGGKTCSGDNVEEIDCNSDIPCCMTSEWSEWSECSAACDGGVQTREKSVNGTDCPQPTSQSRPCNTVPCTETCKTTEWSDWSECSVTCGRGQMTRTRDFEGEADQKCSDELEEVTDCFAGDCDCDEDNEVWSNHTYCERTCVNRFDHLNQTVCDMVREGCICAEGFFRDNGKCVRSSKCDICVVDGEEKKPGETWSKSTDPCYVCECVGGEEVCTRTCEIPKCDDGEELSYDVPNTCCPKCVPVPDTCSLRVRQDYLVDEISGCRSVEQVAITSCAGGCGTSSSSPLLMMSRDMAATQNSCKCCTGEVAEVKAVTVECGEQKTRQEAFYPVLKGCRCNACAAGASPP
ncbi:uncharacterized protein LOC135477432 [Liolophura sinensis]|uniref:uncharacterized protein LOC135477432 n=1 Tax=Liolophura sinensis TaxID=3198878 RepID=UPI0031593A3F